ncbi:MAG: thiol oxidoreductase [Arcobacter sp.]|nr:MAG: thiol oxidoreductase [Arcobacter sp.]
MKTYFSILAVAFFAAACSDNTSSSNANYDYTLLAGKNSISDRSLKSFSHANSNISKEELSNFRLGKSFFRIPWVQAPASTTARDGLGPLFNSNTCMSCHPNNGSGVAVNKKGEMNRSLLFRLALKNKTDIKNGLVPDPHYGAQLNINGNRHVPYEGKTRVEYTNLHMVYSDGTIKTLSKPSYSINDLQYGPFDKELIFSPRIGSILIGLGELEAISTEAILAHEDIEDENEDGISGKANWVYSPESNKSVLGRFTWKASAASVKYQVARAMINDMGLTNPYFPNENCSPFEQECLQSPKGKHEFDVPEKRLNAVTYYTSNLAVPKQEKASNVIEGAKLFTQLSCVSCHVNSFTTKDGNVIHPFTDLLLHDMGQDLADEVTEFLAQGNEWRTAPLWGLGLRNTVSGAANYLHDGRAKSIEEAILWHGGEARKSKKSFMNLAQKDRKSLLDFLNSL